MSLADDELTVRKNHARNGEWVDITMRKVNTLLSIDEDVDWKNYLKILYYMIRKREDHRTSDHEMYIASLKRSENYKAQPYQYASSSKQIQKAKIRGGGLVESYQSNEFSIRVKCNTCGSIVHFTTNHNEFDHFKKGKKIQAAEAREPTKKWNFSFPYTPEQNSVAEKKNITLIEATRTMMNGSVLSKHFWTEAVIISWYTQNKSIVIKRHDKTPYEILKERIHDISYFHVFGCPVFIHNHKDQLGKFDAKADDGYFLGYSFVSKAFRVYNTRRQQIEETYNVTFDESMETIKFTHTSEDEIVLSFKRAIQT
nr:retrovirus-related Pol polyprotein from transposon TNT 1-94 [Tanacetum cinerariifolium]